MYLRYPRLAKFKAIQDYKVIRGYSTHPDGSSSQPEMQKHSTAYLSWVIIMIWFFISNYLCIHAIFLHSCCSITIVPFIIRKKRVVHNSTFKNKIVDFKLGLVMYAYMISEYVPPSLHYT
jgi:hypothetical protein